MVCSVVPTRANVDTIPASECHLLSNRTCKNHLLRGVWELFSRGGLIRQRLQVTSTLVLGVTLGTEVFKSMFLSYLLYGLNVELGPPPPLQRREGISMVFYWVSLDGFHGVQFGSHPAPLFCSENLMGPQGSMPKPGAVGFSCQFSGEQYWPGCQPRRCPPLLVAYIQIQ